MVLNHHLIYGYAYNRLGHLETESGQHVDQGRDLNRVVSACTRSRGFRFN